MNIIQSTGAISTFVVATLILQSGCVMNGPESRQEPIKSHRKVIESPQELTPLESYIQTIRQRIERYWFMPPDIEVASDCVVQVSQAPGGLIINVTFTDCEGNSDRFRESIERAIYKADPLPEPSDMSLFKRDLNIVFRPEK